MGDLRYAIVRIPSSQMVELFTLLVDHGFGEVSFVSNLAHSTVRCDPNSVGDDSPSTSGVRQHVNGLAPAMQATPTTTPQKRQHNNDEDDYNSTSPPASNPADILQSLFDRTSDNEDRRNPTSSNNSNGSGNSHMNGNGNNGGWIMHQNGGGGGGQFNGGPMMPLVVTGPPIGVPVRIMHAPDYQQQQLQHHSQQGYGSDPNGSARKMPYVERMKGWQRRTLANALKQGNGMIPTGDDLTRLCLQAQVTEIQAQRFFRKRKLGQINYEDGLDSGMRPESPDVHIFDPLKQEEQEAEDDE